MPRIPPFHTFNMAYSAAHRNVYHDNPGCKYGREIKTWDRIEGTGGRPRCKECLRLELLGR